MNLLPVSSQQMYTAIETQIQDALNRRIFLRNSTSFLGLSALSGMLQGKQDTFLGLTGFPNFPAKAKRIIYLFQSGAPSQMDLFDPKPAIKDRRGEDLPDSIRKGQRLTTMTSGQKTFLWRLQSSSLPSMANPGCGLAS